MLASCFFIHFRSNYSIAFSLCKDLQSGVGRSLRQVTLKANATVRYLIREYILRSWYFRGDLSAAPIRYTTAFFAVLSFFDLRRLLHHKVDVDSGAMLLSRLGAEIYNLLLVWILLSD